MVRRGWGWDQAPVSEFSAPLYGPLFLHEGRLSGYRRSLWREAVTHSPDTTCSVTLGDDFISLGLSFTIM